MRSNKNQFFTVKKILGNFIYDFEKYAITCI